MHILVICSVEVSIIIYYSAWNITQTFSFNLIISENLLNKHNGNTVFKNTFYMKNYSTEKLCDDMWF